MTGCSTRGPGMTRPHAAFTKAVTATDYDKSGRNEEAIARVLDLFGDYSAEHIEPLIDETYAETLFFRDGFKEYHTREPLKAYLLHGTEALRSCRFDFPSVAWDQGDYYFRWVMSVSLKRDAEGVSEDVIGFSHIRFDEAGKVVFQQDYWDPTDVLYSRIPVAGWLINKVHQRL